MHCVAIGVVKRMPDFWLKKPDHDSYISKKRRTALNRRICAIKPCRYISRLPRSLKQRKLFKASEYRSLLLYYLPVCLKGILKKKYLEHFNLLASSIYTLLKTNISIDELNNADEKLQLFVQQYDELYGKNNMTMNVHLLLHITSTVKRLGPLWSTSMFAFESNNVTFGQYVKGNTDIISQIITKYVIDKAARQKRSYVGKSEKCGSLETKKLLQLGSKDEHTLRENNIYWERSHKNVRIYCVFKKDDVTYTSISYNRSIKTIDYFVKLKNELIGKIKFYIKHGKKLYFILEEFEFVGNVYHITEIKPKQIDSVHLVHEIDNKCMYINFINKHYITDRPNHYEGD